MMKPWIGVDFDGVLAEYNGWQGAGHTGAPIPQMIERVKQWLAEGKDVRIFTARVWYPSPSDLDVTNDDYQSRRDDAKLARRVIHAFCYTQFGRILPVTCQKDPGMIELWDDRAVQVIPNTGVPIEQLVDQVALRLVKGKRS